MANFFALLYLTSFIVFIIFIIKSGKKKKKGEDNHLDKMIWIVSMVVFVVSFVLTGILAPSTPKTESEIVEQNIESPVVEKQKEGTDEVEKPLLTEKPTDKSKPVLDNDSTNEVVPEQVENQFSEDEVVEKFVKDYNSKAEHKMTSFSDGNIKQKLFSESNNCSIEMLHPAYTSEYTFIVTVYGGANEEITEDMFEVVPDMIHTLDSSISDEQIEQCIKDLKNKTTMLSDYKLGDDLIIDYYPCIFRDDGSWLSSSRIEISSLGYANR